MWVCSFVLVCAYKCGCGSKVSAGKQNSWYKVWVLALKSPDPPKRFSYMCHQWRLYSWLLQLRCCSFKEGYLHMFSRTLKHLYVHSTVQIQRLVTKNWVLVCCAKIYKYLVSCLSVHERAHFYKSANKCRTRAFSMFSEIIKSDLSVQANSL